MKTAFVIGGGPAGLMAAQELALAGASVTLIEAKPSLGRKFLMAGKSGLNLTMDEPIDAFTAKYAEAEQWLSSMLHEFGPNEVSEFATRLGQTVFTGSSGRVFPQVMKASPMLRAWIKHLTALNVTISTKWHWASWDDGALVFETPDGPKTCIADVVVLALGGKSWARLGSCTKSLRDRAHVAGVALSRDLFRDLRCWVCAVGRGDFASIDRGFFHEHSTIDTNDAPSCPHDRGHDGAQSWPCFSEQPLACV
jgi:predicted Rossmann fold flavoprotein